MIINFENAIGKIMSFLDISENEKGFNYYKTETDEPQEFLQWKEKIKNKPDPAGIGRFINYFTTVEIECFKGVANELLSFYDYE